MGDGSGGGKFWRKDADIAAAALPKTHTQLRFKCLIPLQFGFEVLAQHSRRDGRPREEVMVTVTNDSEGGKTWTKDADTAASSLSKAGIQLRFERVVPLQFGFEVLAQHPV